MHSPRGREGAKDRKVKMEPCVTLRLSTVAVNTPSFKPARIGILKIPLTAVTEKYIHRKGKMEPCVTPSPIAVSTPTQNPDVILNNGSIILKRSAPYGLQQFLLRNQGIVPVYPDHVFVRGEINTIAFSEMVGTVNHQQNFVVWSV